MTVWKLTAIVLALVVLLLLSVQVTDRGWYDDVIEQDAPDRIARHRAYYQNEPPPLKRNPNWQLGDEPTGAWRLHCLSEPKSHFCVAQERAHQRILDSEGK
jgi:hypothetical protein